MDFLKKIMSDKLRLLCFVLIIALMVSTVAVFFQRKGFERLVTVDFVLDSEENVESVTVNKGTVIEKAPSPTKEGYIFVGWYRDKALTQSYDISLPVTEDVTLYAGFVRLTSALTAEKDTLYFSGCSKDIIFYVDSDSSAALVEEGIRITDELTGDNVRFTAVSSGEGFVVRPEESYIPGHTYIMTLPDSVILNGASDEIRQLGFGIMVETEASIDYNGSLTEIFEQNPSVDSSLHVYTSENVSVGSLVLAGGNDKKIYLVTDTVDTPQGNCLLLAKLDADSVKSLSVAGSFDLSLKNGSIVPSVCSATSSVEDAEKLSALLSKVHNGSLSVDDAAPAVVTDTDKLYVSVSSSENGPFDRRCDLVTVIYKATVTVDGEECTAEVRTSFLVASRLNVFLSKNAGGKLLCDISVSTDSASQTSVKLLGKDGKPLPLNADDFLLGEDGKQASEKISEAIASVLQESVSAILAEAESIVLDGELAVSVKASIESSFNISARSLDLTARQTVSECVGVRGYEGALNAYRRVNAAYASLDGSVAGSTSSLFGIAFDISVSFAKSDHHVADISATVSHGINSAGTFSVAFKDSTTLTEGNAYICLFSEGFAMPGTDLEKANLHREASLLVGSEYIIPADTAVSEEQFSVSGSEFDISHILYEPLVAVMPNGRRVSRVPTLSDITVHFSGELAKYIEFDPENAKVTISGLDDIESSEITLDIYIASSGYTGENSQPIHRTVTLLYSKAEVSDTVEAVFCVNGSVVARKTVPVGSAPGFVGIDGGVFASYTSESFSALWDKDPYLPISSDTEYNLVAEKISGTVAFVYYADGHWRVSYESVMLGSAPASAFADVTRWTAVYPSLGKMSVGLSALPKLTEALAPYVYSAEVLPEVFETEDFVSALVSAKANAACIFVADYHGKDFSVQYTVGGEKVTFDYDKNLLRGGLSELVFEYIPNTVYANTFSGWEQHSYTDNSAAYSAHFIPARFTVTVLAEDGSCVSEETVVIGEIPEFLNNPPEKDGKTGVWLSSLYGNFADWRKYPALAAVMRDITVRPYYGELFTVVVDPNGSISSGGGLYESLVLAPGEFDFDSILPEMQKETDEANSYIFEGWGTRTIVEDTVITAPFVEKAHIYTIIFDAADGLLGDTEIKEVNCTYMELEAVLEKALEENLPVKEPTETRSYTFTEWVKGTADKPYTLVYTAAYEETERLYTITLKAENGGLFPSGESEMTLKATYMSKISGLDSSEYLARIPSEEQKIKVISSWLLGEEKIPLSAELTITGDITLVAEYTERDNPVFTIVLNAGNGRFSNGKTEIVLEGRIGDPVSMPSSPTAPTETGYTSVFLGWNGEIPSVFTENLNLTANYKTEKKVYTVTYYDGDSSIYVVYKVPYGDKIPIPEDPVSSGNSFIGWEGLPESGLMGASDLKIYPKFDRTDYHIYFYVDGELYHTQTLYYGERIYRRFFAYKPGYTFSGWTYPSYSTMPAKDLVVTGSFTKGKYKITYIHNGEVYSQTEATFEDTVKLPALPAGASAWKSTDVTITDGSFVMPYEPVVISTDSTGVEYTVSFTVDGKVIAEHKYGFGSKIAAPAVPTDQRFTGKWLYRPAEGGGDVAVTDYMPNMDLVAVPELVITDILSGKDINGNGVDDYTDLVNTAREYVNSQPIYRSVYYGTTGYPTDWYGVCTDVIWRAYLGIGVNFKDLVDSDIAYGMTLGDANPYKDQITKPSPAIDFRRVRNLLIYYQNNATVLTNDTTDPTEWQPGDIVVFSPSHIAICSDKRDSEGLPYVIHHTESRGPIESDELGKFNIGNYTVVGHFRIDPDALK